MSAPQRVAIVGAGITGLWLADELARAGDEVALIDSRPMAAFSSTRNQGWLHSGALFAAHGAYEAARESRVGQRAFRRFAASHCPAALGAQPIYFLFGSAPDRDQAAARCSTAGIEVTTSGLDEVVDRSPLMQGDGECPLPYALRTTDMVIDTSALLSTVAERAVRCGTALTYTSDVGDVAVMERGDRWVLTVADLEIEAHVVVLACGPRIPAVLSRALPERAADVADDYLVTETTVVSVPDRAVGTAGLVPVYDRAPHVIPRWAGGISRGVSMCLAFDNQPADASERPDPSSIDDLGSRILESALWAYPGLRDRIDSDQGLPVAVHRCAKVVSGRRRQDWRSGLIHWPARNLAVVYPGKFTATPAVLRQFSRELASQAVPRPRLQALRHGAYPVVARQPLVDESTATMKSTADGRYGVVAHAPTGARVS